MISHIQVRRKPGPVAHHGLLRAGSRQMICALGRSGITAFKREGDGATPLLDHAPILFGYFRADRISQPKTCFPLHALKADDGWCDAPTHPTYNRPVRLPFAPSHEIMQRDDSLYDICLVLDYNYTRRKRFGGSAIFFHCAKQGYPPTEGCIALSRSDLMWVLTNLAPGATLSVV